MRILRSKLKTSKGRTHIDSFYIAKGEFTSPHHKDEEYFAVQMKSIHKDRAFTADCVERQMKAAMAAREYYNISKQKISLLSFGFSKDIMLQVWYHMTNYILHKLKYTPQDMIAVIHMISKGDHPNNPTKQ